MLPERTPIFRSRLASALTLTLGLTVLLGAVQEGSRPLADADFERSVCDAAGAWRAKYPGETDLQVARVDVSFRGTAKNFVRGEGFVSVPVGLDLPDAQRVLEVRAYPRPSRVIRVDGISNVTWDYAGEVMRDMRFMALSLVRRSAAQRATLPQPPTFESLSVDSRAEALLRADQLEEHGLHDCKAFPGWVKQAAGPPPYTDQVVRIARQIRRGMLPSSSKKEVEDVCAAIRSSAFRAHHAHVVLVMAARELGAPAYGFFSAEPRPRNLVGLFVDGQGWVTLDVMEPWLGFTRGGSALLAKAPALVEFEATAHEFWRGSATAFTPSSFGPRYLSSTSWLTEPAEAGADLTRVSSRPLTEVCK